MKKTLTDIDGVLAAQRATDTRPRRDKSTDTIFGLGRKQDGQLDMGNKVVQLDGETLLVDGVEYKLKPGVFALITNANLHDLINGKPMIIKYTNRSLHRTRLNHSRIGQAVLDHTLRGNGNI